eukprot:TRINITY_DN7703_c0_g1_i4.p1 TRINITY_DN7703_c0_g1~~TRINITY_DN7703_c0_g1_i4.p1  ORF type:complete len:277 (-),score=17.77 TRINITY_DN7703_c0_g1_i4:61-891(-)
MGYDVFDPKCHPTVGIDFTPRTLQLEDRVVRLQLWDTAGQERFRSLIPGYIRDSSVAIIVFDVTKKETFVNVNKWYEDVRQLRGSDIVIALIGNKTDQKEAREVTTEEGEKRAKELDVIFVECSAKDGANVQQVFKNIGQFLPGNEPSQLMSTTGYNMGLNQNTLGLNGNTEKVRLSVPTSHGNGYQNGQTEEGKTPGGRKCCQLIIIMRHLIPCGIMAGANVNLHCWNPLFIFFFFVNTKENITGSLFVIVVAFINIVSSRSQKTREQPLSLIHI